MCYDLELCIYKDWKPAYYAQEGTSFEEFGKLKREWSSKGGKIGVQRAMIWDMAFMETENMPTVNRMTSQWRSLTTMVDNGALRVVTSCDSRLGCHGDWKPVTMKRNKLRWNGLRNAGKTIFAFSKNGHFIVGGKHLLHSWCKIQFMKDWR